MFTDAARRELRANQRAHQRDLGGVASRRDLTRIGIDAGQIRAQVAARRWRLAGKAVVLHNGQLTRHQVWHVALINCGPRAVLTSFTAAEAWGLRGWTRDEIHVLAPAGTTRPPMRGLRLHRSTTWPSVDLEPTRKLHALAPALVLAASGFASSRPGCGLLAASVQQHLLTPAALRHALANAPRARHRAALGHAIDDIEQGARAMSEIDFGRLCRRYHLPPPTRQAVRFEPSGRRRFLDSEWRLPDGRIVAVEVDGAYHLSTTQWRDDQLRQNDIVIGGTLVLRYPSVVVRDDPALVARQLRQALASQH